MWGFCGASGQAGGRDGPRLPCSVPGTALGPSCGQTPQPVGEPVPGRSVRTGPPFQWGWPVGHVWADTLFWEQ